MKALRHAFFVAALALLTACAAQAPRPQPSASVPIAAPAAPAPVTEALPAAASAPDLWTRLREDFVLDDCGNPRAQTWAKRLTRNPRLFAAQLQQALPLIAWVQDAADRAGVAGELVLLPMVESSYNPAEPGRGGDPAGMWQIMPRTARTMGLDIGDGYDGRLDPAASTEAVMAMLKGYHDELHDWRLVDMAFNAGAYKMREVLDGGKHASMDKPLRLPVSATTRDHLDKLMAMACIVRDPARFEVDLPQTEGGYELTLVRLPQAVDLASAARAAEIPLAQLRSLNPGYRGKRMPEDAPHHLLLPLEGAQRLGAALDAQGAAALVADSGAKKSAAPAKATLASASEQRGASRHRVERGESLWSIARHYRIDPAKLRSWNALASDNLRPGQSLLLSAQD